MKPYYTDENVTLYHGDCREVILSLSADLVLTDPPYNVGLNYSDGDNRTDYLGWSREWFDLCPRPLVFTPGMVNLTMWYAIAAPTWLCAWFKFNQASPSGLGGFNVWEPVLVYGKPRKHIGHDAWAHLVSFRERERGAGDHPCPKTLSFWQRLMSAFTEPSDVVLDPFVGSGTTLVAAKMCRLKVIGVEIEERYCEIAAKRCEQPIQESIFQQPIRIAESATQEGLFAMAGVVD